MDEKQLLKTALFKGMDKDELGQSLHALHARERHFDKGETILHVGRSTHEMGLVLSGSVRIESLDEMGNRTILNLIVPGQYFAEAYALLGNEPTLVEVAANEPTRILFLDLQNLKPGSCRCGGWETKVLYNLTLLGAQKNLALSRRSFFTSSRTIRSRVLAYLRFAALKKGSRVFEIPFDRQQLADYLNVERSALSKELGRMKKEGLIAFEKNHFELLDPAKRDLL